MQGHLVRLISLLQGFSRCVEITAHCVNKSGSCEAKGLIFQHLLPLFFQSEKKWPTNIPLGSGINELRSLNNRWNLIE